MANTVCSLCGAVEMTDVLGKDIRLLLGSRVRILLYDRGVMSLGSTVKGYGLMHGITRLPVHGQGARRQVKPSAHLCVVTFMIGISDGKQQCYCKFHDNDGVYTVEWGQFSYSAKKRSVKISKCILKIQLFGRSGMLEYYRRYLNKRHACLINTI